MTTHFRFVLFHSFCCFGVLLGAMCPALAACNTPDGVGAEGEMVYNIKYKVMQYCNGTDWIAMVEGPSEPEVKPDIGTVMAFDLEACPEGWEPYALSSGQFIRGRCIAGEACADPSGVRAIGSTQTDDFISHTHTLRSRHNAADWNGASIRATDEGGSIIGSTTSATGGDETRPINVALLHCIAVD